MKKILSIVLVMLFVLSMAASAATAGVGGSVNSALGAELMSAGGGFDIELSKESATLIKAKVKLTGTLNYVTAAYVAISYDSNNIVLVNATDKATEYIAANSAIQDGYAEDLGSGEKSADWPATAAKIGFSGTRGYAVLGFIRLSASVLPRTFEGKDWYNIYFKVKNGVDVNDTNFGTYFWKPTTAGPDLSKITMIAPGASASESVAIQSPTGTDTASVIKSVNFQRFTFASAATNKITAAIDGAGTGKVLVNGNAVANGSEVDLGAATTAKIKIMPTMGSSVPVATLGGVSMNIPANGGTFDATGITGTQPLVVTFATRTDTDKPQAANIMFKKDNVTFPGAAGPKKSLTTFASAPVGFTEKGIKLQDATGDYVTPSGDGPMFASTTEVSATTSQFGIEFIGLPAGTYTATPYAVVGGLTVEGLAVTFTVE